MSITIIESKDTDLLAALNHDVQQIHVEIEPDIFKPYSKEKMRQLFDDALQSGNFWSYVAYWETQPAGYILISKRDYPETPFRYGYSVLYIDQICVAAEFRGKKVGKELVDKVKSVAVERGFKRIELDFWSKNENSGEFFGSQGFNVFYKRMYIEI